LHTPSTVAHFRPKMPYHPAAIILLLALLLTPCLVRAGDPWQAMLEHDMTQAADLFAEQLAESPENPRLALAYATALLGRQPRTNSNIEESRRLLRELLAARHQAPNITPSAQFLLGRIAHHHLSRPDLAEARTHYEELIRSYPDHPLAGVASVHLGSLLLEVDSGVPLPEALTRIDTLAAETRSGPSRAELLLLGGRIRLQLEGDTSAALERFLAARVIGVAALGRNGDIDLTIGTLAARLGKHELAARHYRAFADEFPRDTRAYTARRLAAESEAAINSVALSEDAK
jgi:tetratricopeptide (TPR) repeat protein